jgi:hypothetical protein
MVPVLRSNRQYRTFSVPIVMVPVPRVPYLTRTETESMAAQSVDALLRWRRTTRAEIYVRHCLSSTAPRSSDCLAAIFHARCRRVLDPLIHLSCAGALSLRRRTSARSRQTRRGGVSVGRRAVRYPATLVLLCGLGIAPSPRRRAVCDLGWPRRPRAACGQNACRRRRFGRRAELAERPHCA